MENNGIREMSIKMMTGEASQMDWGGYRIPKVKQEKLDGKVPEIV